MKRKEVLALLLVGILLSGAAASAAAEVGSAGDPLIALNWLKNTFIPNAVSQAEERVDERVDELGEKLSQEAVSTELRVKRADVLWLESGSTLTPLAGDLGVLAANGAVVDITAGEELPGGDGAALPDHRYMAAEDTRAAFSVTSDTAVVRLTGPYRLSPSGEMDYNALADALKEMGLFRGSDVAYGSGYELEEAPTRIQGLVMFVRLMGEEELALHYPGSGIEFADVPDWAVPYVAFAYDRGYTKGQAIDQQWRVVFGSEDPLAARDYVTFLLRALGYAEDSDFQWLTAVEDAKALGVLTEKETALLTDKPFLRAQVVYLSYHSLSAKLVGAETTLLDRLVMSGAVRSATVKKALEAVEAQRL